MTKKNGFLLIEVTVVSTILLLISSIMARITYDILKTHCLVECHLKAVTTAIMVSETNIPISLTCDNYTINTSLSLCSISIPDLPLDKPFVARDIQITVQKGEVSKKVYLRAGSYDA